LAATTLGGAVLLDEDADSGLERAGPVDEEILEGSVTSSTFTEDSLTLLIGEGDGLAFSELTFSCSKSLSVSDMLSAKLWFSAVSLVTGVPASLFSGADVVSVKQKRQRHMF